MTALKTIRVAVTGVGGGCGQGNVKALMQAHVPGYRTEIYPVDITPFSAGLHRCQGRGVVLPRPEDDIKAWEHWLDDNRIDLVLPGSDHDLLPLSRVADDWFKRRLTNVVVSNPRAVTAANDKAFTSAALVSSGVSHPRTLVPANGQDMAAVHAWASYVGYPIVIKPRKGMTSRGLHVVQDEAEFDFVWNRVSDCIAQEWVEGEEFTCALFFDRFNNPQASFVMKRDLYAGTTYHAESRGNDGWSEITDFLYEMAEKLCAQDYRFMGPLNIQLKMTQDGPVVIELNARASGSTAIRAHFGYNEAEMVINHFILGKPAHQPDTKAGYAFRYWDELFIDGAGEADIAGVKRGMKGVIPSWL